MKLRSRGILENAYNRSAYTKVKWLSSSQLFAQLCQGNDKNQATVKFPLIHLPMYFIQYLSMNSIFLFKLTLCKPKPRNKQIS